MVVIINRVFKTKILEHVSFKIFSRLLSTNVHFIRIKSLYLTIRSCPTFILYTSFLHDSIFHVLHFQTKSRLICFGACQTNKVHFTKKVDMPSPKPRIRIQLPSNSLCYPLLDIVQQALRHERILIQVNQVRRLLGRENAERIAIIPRHYAQLLQRTLPLLHNLLRPLQLHLIRLRQLTHNLLVLLQPRQRVLTRLRNIRSLAHQIGASAATRARGPNTQIRHAARQIEVGRRRGQLARLLGYMVEALALQDLAQIEDLLLELADQLAVGVLVDDSLANDLLGSVRVPVS